MIQFSKQVYFGRFCRAVKLEGRVLTAKVFAATMWGLYSTSSRPRTWLWRLQPSQQARSLRMTMQRLRNSNVFWDRALRFDHEHHGYPDLIWAPSDPGHSHPLVNTCKNMKGIVCSFPQFFGASFFLSLGIRNHVVAEEWKRVFLPKWMREGFLIKVNWLGW